MVSVIPAQPVLDLFLSTCKWGHPSPSHLFDDETRSKWNVLYTIQKRLVTLISLKINHLKRIVYLQLAIWRTQTCLSSGYKRKSIGQANVNEILEQKAENTWNVLKEKSVWICKFNLPMYSSRTNNHRGNVFISVTKNRKKLYLFSTGKQKTT